MPYKEPWNKGRVIGQSPPLTPDQVDLIRLLLAQRRSLAAVRDLALFNTALDSELRGCDLLRLRVRDVSSPERGVWSEAHFRQQKTGEPVTFSMSERTRQSLERWMLTMGKHGGDYLFTAIKGNTLKAVSVERFRMLVKDWTRAAGLDPTRYTPHSLRRTQAAYIYQQTGNLRAAQLLLGHRNIETTVRYLGIDKAEALDIARKYHL